MIHPLQEGKTATFPFERACSEYEASPRGNIHQSAGIANHASNGQAKPDSALWISDSDSDDFSLDSDESSNTASSTHLAPEVSFACNQRQDRAK